MEEWNYMLPITFKALDDKFKFSSGNTWIERMEIIDEIPKEIYDLLKLDMQLDDLSEYMASKAIKLNERYTIIDAIITLKKFIRKELTYDF